MKKTISVILVILLVSTMPLATSAAIPPPQDEAFPCWEYMDSIEVNINFSGVHGTASVTVDRYFGLTSSLEATLTVYKKSGK